MSAFFSMSSWNIISLKKQFGPRNSLLVHDYSVKYFHSRMMKSMIRACSSLDLWQKYKIRSCLSGIFKRAHCSFFRCFPNPGLVLLILAKVYNSVLVLQCLSFDSETSKQPGKIHSNTQSPEQNNSMQTFPSKSVWPNLTYTWCMEIVLESDI